MDYQIKQRMQYILDEDKMQDPQRVCKLLEEDLKSVIENYLSLSEDIKVRYKKENNKKIFFVEIQAQRIKPFGYVP